MGEELHEQAPKIDTLQQRTDEAGLSLKGVSRGAARLVGPAPRQHKRSGTDGPTWAADQDAAAAAVARAAVAAAPTALKYGGRLR